MEDKWDRNTFLVKLEALAHDPQAWLEATLIREESMVTNAT